MTHPILGLHHVTATVDDAQADLDFCLNVLGMRLVKKTVNFDNRSVYHFYYGTERGAPGTIWTTFPYKGKGVRVGVKGAGQVVATSFSVPASSLGFWAQRLRDQNVETREATGRFGEDALQFADPSGLWFELVGTARDTRTPWTGNGVGADAAIRGIHSVTMTVRSIEHTREVMTDLLGYQVVDEAANRTRFAAGGDAPGHAIDVVVDPEMGPAINGVGTVHHVAMAISNDDEQLRLREELLRYGLRPTDVRDRCYFHSVYFREPGGVLFEVATVAPGFTLDEELPALGRGLQLPPWEEPDRRAIEAGLPYVEYR
ncbi:MAG TPA: ring-cleaving dioxygenase [Vicinamibacterales bacterium]|nr:ring-cleaving dioxygenase [Vicinamibacterales bacterium]